jgi:hypothetical protein
MRNFSRYYRRALPALLGIALCGSLALSGLRAQTGGPGPSVLDYEGGPNDPFPVLDLGSTTKIVVVRLQFSSRQDVALSSSKVVMGLPHTYLGDPALLRIRLSDRTGMLMQEFNAWHPLWAREWAGNRDRRILLPRAEGRFVIPFSPTLKMMQVIDGASGQTLTTIDLASTTVRPYCLQHRSDPDCTGFPFGPRALDGLQALYTFDEGAGPTVNDVSGSGTPLNLHISNSAATHWVAGGLAIDTAVVVESATAASKVNDAIKASGEVTIEAWVTPTARSSDAIGRMVTISSDITDRNIALDLQSRDNSRPGRFASYLRTTATGTEGAELRTSARFVPTQLTHILFTRDNTGAARLYVNGVEQKRARLVGDLSSWDSSLKLALANEFAGGSPWLGEFHLVSLYSRALTPAEVRQNFHAGPDGDAIVCYATADSDDDGVRDQLIVFSDSLSATTRVDRSGTEDIEALTFQPGTNVLFAVNADRLGTLDLSTGDFSPMPQEVGRGRGAGGVIEFKNIDGLAFDQTDGALFAVHRRSANRMDREVLFQIDPVSGAAIANTFGPGVDYVVIDGIGLLPDIDDIVISPHSGQMYATSDDNGRGGALVAISKETGAATVSGPYGVEDVDGLTFTEDGTLYGLTGNSFKGNTTDSRVYRIDLSTGIATEVNRLVPVRDYESAACPPQVPVSVSPRITVTPQQGRIDQLTTIIVEGSNFNAGTVVRIGNRLLDTTILSATQLQAVVPVGMPIGMHDVVVIYADGTEMLLHLGFVVYPRVNNRVYLPLLT